MEQDCTLPCSKRTTVVPNNQLLFQTTHYCSKQPTIVPNNPLLFQTTNYCSKQPTVVPYLERGESSACFSIILLWHHLQRYSSLSTSKSIYLPSTFIFPHRSSVVISLSHNCQISYTSHSHAFDHANNIWLKLKLTQLLLSPS